MADLTCLYFNTLSTQKTARNGDILMVIHINWAAFPFNNEPCKYQSNVVSPLYIILF